MLKVDALLESAAKHIIRHGLQVKLMKQTFRHGPLDDFVDTLPMNGRTSLLKLLEASGFPEDELRFIEVTRQMRNAYAHNIEYADLRITQLLKTKNDKSGLLKHLIGIKYYDEGDVPATYEKDPLFLRFCIIDSAMRVLFYAYHLTSNQKQTPRTSNSRKTLYGHR